MRLFWWATNFRQGKIAKHMTICFQFELSLRFFLHLAFLSYIKILVCLALTFAKLIQKYKGKIIFDFEVSGGEGAKSVEWIYRKEIFTTFNVELDLDRWRNIYLLCICKYIYVYINYVPCFHWGPVWSNLKYRIVHMYLNYVKSQNNS